MIKKVTMMAAMAAATVSFAKAQDTLQISGSVDTYFKYDFEKGANIQTSFASDHNSVSLGMLDLALKKSTGKASFVGELSFGPRGQLQSIPGGDGSGSFHIQNLYTTYAFTDKFSMTAGYMGTFIGYEVISPVANYNYSTSYLFTNGPFQNAGIKANATLSDKIGVMVGLFNSEWNAYSATPTLGLNNFGAQISLAPIKGWNAYLNMITGSTAGTEFDLTTAYQITDKFKLGLNVADYSAAGDSDEGFTGGALYASYGAIGVRAESFKSKAVSSVVYSGVVADESVFALTVSGNIKAGGLTVIPEIRFDNGSTNMFRKSGTLPTAAPDSKSASQFALALVYAF
ncbi:porin [Hufsiella ginkgonis]|uniref:Outer membrane beta-barrel protein n=1 Tax=Hufsiella ginkgonis TaxID=2695274 RepID=A0A7K1Y3K3_9SPHI|nr:porin [Hufsiella ginkgonis]MXV17873.1 outer membrane beta-barrel protein [Hufsiella ginkgonis]